MKLSPILFTDSNNITGPEQDEGMKQKQSNILHTIDKLLGPGKRTIISIDFPSYYGGLLAWALNRYLEEKHWTIINTFNHQYDEPKFDTLQLDYHKKETLLTNAHLLVQKDSICLNITLEIRLGVQSLIHVEGNYYNASFIETFTDEISKFAHENNYYRGKRLEFGYLPRFLIIKNRPWNSVIIPDETRREISANTIDFFRKKSFWQKFGIPLKRGILLSGQPGIGKTIICKALIAEAEDITCITVRAQDLELGDSISQLYEMAADLKPSILFIEDLDIIARKRDEFNLHEEAFVTLLNVMDGLEEKEEIITVATTNHIDMLDKALRPSRFDKVISLEPPNSIQRKNLVSLLCQQIPLDENIKDYIAIKTEGFTPAQIQEVIFSLVIEQAEKIENINNPSLSFCEASIDNIIRRNNPKSSSMGFLNMNATYKSDGRRF